MQHALKLLALLPLACASAVAAPDSSKPAAPATPPAAKQAPPTAAKPAPGPPAPAPTPAPAAACRPSGAAIFEIDHRVDPGAKLSTSTTKVYGNGAWTHDETDADGKALAPTAGCYTKADVKKLETTLTGAEWKVTTSHIHCMAVSATFVEYQVHGKSVFTRKLCSGQDLDEKSRTKLQAAIEQVEGTVPATP